MTGRENSEDNFEQEWRGAFDGWSEEAPSAVWRDIDRRLAYEAVKTYKTKVVIYQWVAAAAILLSFSFGIIQYFGEQPTTYVISAAADIDSPNQLRVGAIELQENEEISNGVNRFRRDSGMDDSFGRSGSTYQTGMVAYQDNSSIESGSNTIDFANTDDFEKIEVALIDLNAIGYSPETTISSNHEEKFIYFLPVNSRGKKHQMSDEPKYWAGIDVGSGSFNPNYNTNVSSLESLGVSSANGFSQNSNGLFDSESPNLRENMTPGETVSMGVNFGIMLGDRWRLHSGVQYARAGATTETNILVRTSTLQEGIPATGQGKNIPAVAHLVASENVVEYDYEDVDMSNVFEFTSIPVKAGYLILDQKLSVEVNAGVVTNIYLGNRLTTDNPDVAELTIGPGDASPYRDLSFSGLAGVQLGYRFMKKIDIIVEPNYRQSINTLTKSSSNFSTTPSGFGFMTGLRYNFN